MTAFYERLQRQVRLLMACLMLALASAPPADVAARDASVLSVSAVSAAAQRGPAQGAQVLQRVAAAPAQAAPRVAGARAGAAPREGDAPRIDRRYLYLELLSLLC